MAAGFKTATVNASDVPGTLTNYPAYVNLSRLGITTLSEAQSVRVYSDFAKTTELPREIVSVSEMHVRIPSLTSTFVIYVDWDDLRADYAVGATFGRNAVWSDYASIWHGIDDTTSQALDSTGNGRHGVKTGANQPQTQTSTLYGNEYDFPSNFYLRSQNVVYDITTTPFTTQLIFKVDALPGGTDSYGLAVINSGLNSGARDKQIQLEHTGRILFQLFDGASKVSQTATSYVTAGNYYMAHGVFSGSNATLYANATAQTAATVSTSFNHTDAGLQVSDQIGNTKYINGQVKEVRFRLSALSANWITTEYSNHFDEAGFWGTWSDAGGGGGSPTPTLMMMGVGT